LLAACGDGDAVMDMSVSDLTVENDLRPVDAGFLHECPMVQIPTTIHVTGTLTDLSGTAAAGIAVSFYKAAGDVLLATATYGGDAGSGAATATDGYFEFDAATDGSQFLGYFLFTGANIPTTRWYLQIRGSFGAMAPVPTHDQLTVGYTAAGASQESGKGVVVGLLDSCAGKRIAGATGTFLPAAGVVRYTDGTSSLPSMTATSTSKDGSILGFNVPAGPATLTAIVGAQEIASPTFTVPADGLVLLDFNP
jgi:hypothetical protein